MTNRRRIDHHRFTSALDREWRRLRYDRTAIAAARSWASDADVDADVAAMFATCDDLDAIVAASQGGAPSGNRVLLALVERAGDDRLAGRIVVQRLLPGLVSASSRYRFLCDGGDPVELAVGGLWIAIHRYDHAVRVRHVASTLISDAIFATFRRQLRLRSFDEAVTAPSDFDRIGTGRDVHAADEVAQVVAEARIAGVPSRDLDLVERLVVTGSADAVAAERGVTTRTIRNHRQRAVRRIRHAVAA